MEIASVIDGRYLFSVNNVLPAHLKDLVYQQDWSNFEYERLIIGYNRRRLIQNPVAVKPINDYLREIIVPEIEKYCQVRYTQLENFSVSWWLDEPGFIPHLHTDGNLPSAMQLYWLPQDRTDLGTEFYYDRGRTKSIKLFKNEPNSGYIMFNAHEYNGQKQLLWHDMQQTVPEGVTRLSSYVWLGPYELL